MVVELHLERPGWKTLFHDGDRILRDLARLRVELSEELIAEIRIPGHPGRVDDHVVRLGQLPRQVVFRDDDARRPSVRPRERLERILPRFARAQIDARQPGSGALKIASTRRIALRAADQWLRTRRRAAWRVNAHPLDDFYVFIRVMSGPHDALEGVAAGAVEKKSLLRVGAGHAGDPFRVGQLRGEIPGRAELDVSRRRCSRANVRGLGAVQLVADGANSGRIVARPQLRGREAVTAL